MGNEKGHTGTRVIDIVRVCNNSNGQSKTLDFLVSKSNDIKEGLKYSTLRIYGTLFETDQNNLLEKVFAHAKRKPSVILIFDWLNWKVEGNLTDKAKSKIVQKAVEAIKLRGIQEFCIHVVELNSLTSNLISEIENALVFIRTFKRSGSSSRDVKPYQAVYDFKNKWFPSNQNIEYTKLDVKEFRDSLAKLPKLESSLVRYIFIAIKLNGTMEWVFKDKETYRNLVINANISPTLRSKINNRKEITSKAGKPYVVYSFVELFDKMVNKKYLKEEPGLVADKNGLDVSVKQIKAPPATASVKEPHIDSTEASSLPPEEDSIHLVAGKAFTEVPKEPEEDNLDKVVELAKLFRKLSQDQQNLISNSSLRKAYGGLVMHVKTYISNNVMTLTADEIKAQVDILTSIEENLRGI